MLFQAFQISDRKVNSFNQKHLSSGCLWHVICLIKTKEFQTKTKLEDNMVYTNSLKKFLTGIFLLIFTFSLLLLTSACQQNDSVVGSTSDLSQNEALKKIAEEDEVLQSFDANYNESEAMDFLAKTNMTVYPARVWHKIDTRDFNLELTIAGDTAYGVSTKTFTGTLYIAASLDEFEPGEIGVVDTVIEKPFTTVVTRNIIFVKVAETGDQKRDWKIISISLPEGGTGTTNIYITKLTATLPNGEVLEVTSPNDYYLSRNTGDRMGNKGNQGNGNRGQGGPRGNGGMGPRSGFDNNFMGQFPTVNLGVPVLLTVELESAYADTDYVAVSFGGDKFGRNRAKRSFELVSSVSNGATYSKVYQGQFEPRALHGFFHAVVNAIPYHVIHDDSTPVEKVCWGVPYAVQ